MLLGADSLCLPGPLSHGCHHPPGEASGPVSLMLRRTERNGACAMHIVVGGRLFWHPRLCTVQMVCLAVPSLLDCFVDAGGLPSPSFHPEIFHDSNAHCSSATYCSPCKLPIPRAPVLPDLAPIGPYKLRHGLESRREIGPTLRVFKLFLAGVVLACIGQIENSRAVLGWRGACTQP